MSSLGVGTSADKQLNELANVLVDVNCYASLCNRITVSVDITGLGNQQDS